MYPDHNIIETDRSFFLPGAGAAFASLPLEAAGAPKLKPEEAGAAVLLSVVVVDEAAAGAPKEKPPAAGAGAGVLEAPPPNEKPPPAGAGAGAGVLVPAAPNEKPPAAGAGDGAPKLNAMVVMFCWIFVIFRLRSLLRREGD